MSNSYASKRRAAITGETHEEDLSDVAVDSPDEGDFTKALAEAAAIAPGLTGQLAWVNQRLVAAGKHSFDAVWEENFREFFESGKQELICCGGLRSAKTSSALRAILPIALFQRHNLEPGETGLFPVISSRLDLSTLALGDIEQTCLACGIAPARNGDERQPAPGGLGGTYLMTRTSAGGGNIDIVSPWGYTVKVRCMAAKFGSAVAYSSVGSFLDEVDIWCGSTGANPASEILRGLRQRSTTTRATARTIIASSYYPDREKQRGEPGAFRGLVEQGDTEIQYVAKLGAIGAARDETARRLLAGTIKSTDPRLLAPGNPLATSIATWAARPDLKILDLYRDEEKSLDRLFSAFGAQFQGSKSAVKNSAIGLADMARAINARVAGNVDGHKQFANLPSWDPRSTRYRPEGGGGRGGRGVL